MIDLNGAPYYDDYSPEKDYTRVLTVAGRVAQSRDLNQAQSIQTDLLSRLGSAVFREGTIVSGCSLMIDESKKSATLSDGQAFLNGLVRNVPVAEVGITGEGSEFIGLTLKQEYITENEDDSLYDQTEGFKNSGQPGSHRLKETVEVSANDPQSVPIYYLNNGEIIVSTDKLNADNITETLARRTYDENGSYKVRGMSLRDRKEHDDTHVYVDLTEGKAYVRGYELNKYTVEKIELDKSIDTRQRMNEIHTYTSGSQYRLTYQPVKELTRISCLIEYSKKLTRGDMDGGADVIHDDPLIEGSVDSIVKIQSGGTLYNQGTDYNLTSGNVDWSPEGKEPEAGSTYDITYRFNQKMDLKEFELVEEDGVYLVKFNESTSHPVASSRMYIDYTYYLARMDLLTLDSNGIVHVYKGDPDRVNDVRSKINENEDELVLGTVLVYPNSNDVKIINFDTIRLSQKNLFNLRQRVDNLEYNIAMSDLDKEAVEGEPATELRGVFTDGFIGLTKCDLGHEDFNCSMDFDEGFVTVPQKETIVGIAPAPSEGYKEKGGIITVPYTEHEAIKQPEATDGFLVNEYQVFHNLALVELEPYVDNWVDSEHMTIDGGIINEEKSVEVNGGTRTQRVTRGGFFQDYTETSYSYETSTHVETSTRTQSEILSEEAIYYMRQIPIKVHGSNYLMNSDNLTCTFNGIKVDLTPLESTEAGTNPGTVKCNAEGIFDAQFTIPEGVPCGKVEVLISNDNNNGGTVFSAQGRKQVIQDTVFTVHTTVTTTTKYTTVTTIHDPLAQAFYADDDMVITKLGLYFKAKDDSKNIVVQIRNMVNGYPGPHIYDQVVVDSDEVKVSGNGSVETVVGMAQPVYLPAGDSYCIAVLSDSDKYEMWIAILGNQFVDREELMLNQPYTEGAMFSSSNAVTWTAHQDRDLKFTIYTAAYETESPIIIDFPIADFDGNYVSGIILTAQTADFRNSGVNWYFRVLETDPWTPIQPFVFRPLDNLTSKVYLKCEMVSKSDVVSPFLNKDSINLIGYLDEDEGTYLSRTVYMDQEFNTIKASFEGYVPADASYNLYYSLDQNNESWHELTEPTETELGEGWKRYEFTTENNLHDKICKLKLKMTSGNPVDIPKFKKLVAIMKNV